MVTLTLGAISLLSAWIWVRARRGRRARAIHLSHIDEMPGTQFEQYLATVLTFKGYDVTATPATGDLGVDLTATRDGQTSAIQVKRSAKPISRRAVSDAVAGMRHYSCTAAMVITNGYFTSGARTLAESTECRLVDRDELSSWILDFQKKSQSTMLGRCSYLPESHVNEQ